MVVGKTVNEVIPEPSLTMVQGKYRQAIEEKTTVIWEETSDYPTAPPVTCLFYRRRAARQAGPFRCSLGRPVNLVGGY